MKMPFLAIALALALGLGATAVVVHAAADQTQSQAPTAHGGHHHNLMNQALAQLQLSADQQSKIASLRAAYHAKVKAETDPNAKRADAAQFRSDVLAVLTPDQATQLKATMKSLRMQARAQQNVGALPAASPAASPSR